MSESTEEKPTRTSLRNTRSSLLPPGPKGHWLLGCYQPMARDPLGFLSGIAQKHGDIVHYRAFLWNVILLNSPESLRYVLQDNNKNYNKQNFDYKLLKPVAGEGLLTSDGEFWLRQRRMIQPIFQRRRIASFGDMMVAETLALLNHRWAPYFSTGEPFDLAEEMMHLTLLIVGRTLFGVDLSQEAKEIGHGFTVVSRRLGKFDAWSLVPTWLPIGPNREYNRVLKHMNQTVHRMVRERRQILQDSPEKAPSDLLTLLLQARDEETGEAMDDKQIRDEIATLMVAGHETTALSLSWTWHLLSKHPDVAEKLYAEVDRVLAGRPPTLDDLPNLPYTLQVIEESMRIYPPAWALSRNTIDNDTFHGYPIPKGTIVVIAPYVMHRHPDYWPEPEEFRPERFAPENAQQRPKYAYVPFGGGPRLCIGKHMAMMESHLVLATMAQHIRVAPDPTHTVEMEPLITLRPKTGIHVTATRRRP